MTSAVGVNLRKWRESKGLSLEAAAASVEILATARKIPKNSKSVPRTHASLSRWETGKVSIKDVGIDLLAEVYGTTAENLRRPPPPQGEAPKRQVDVKPEHAPAVEAFIESLERRGS